jgi:quercetin dioxygenase-like cupin family protein
MKLKFRGDRKMLRAFKLYTGPDHASHVLEGTIDEKDRTDVVAIHFHETPAHSSYDWHPAPEKQFVITLSGTLEFVTPDGEKFVVRPGDILLAEDNAGEGHKWRLIDDQPWRRAYVVLKPGAADSFVAKTDPSGPR